MPRIVEEFGLEEVRVPHFITVCHAKQEFKIQLWRVLLRMSAFLHELGEVPPIGFTGFGRRAVSRHYGKRIPY